MKKTVRPHGVRGITWLALFSPKHSLLYFTLNLLCQHQPFPPIEQVKRLKRNHPPVRLGEMHTGLFQRPQVEVRGVHELHDQHAEDVFVGQLGSRNGRQAAEQGRQAAGLRLG